MKNYKNGFIALFSVIIISFVLVLVSITLSFTGYITRFDILDSEYKKMSESLTDACLEKARLKLAFDNNYIGNEEINLGSKKCNYEILNGGEIIAYSVVGKANTNYWIKVETEGNKIPIIDFKECQKLSPCP